MNEWVIYNLKSGLAKRKGQVLHKSFFICAFCKGEGLTGPNKKARCQVCGGKGTINVIQPVVVCAYCSGRGTKNAHSFLVCTICHGKGVIPIKEPVVVCKVCKGKGSVSGNALYCLTCHGRGVLEVVEKKKKGE